MKKTIVALSTIFCAVLVAVSIYTMIPESADSHQNMRTVEAGYIIKDSGGKVAVFREGSDEPIEVYDMYTHLLPENDIELLRRGIYVQNMTELQTRLEDLGL